MQTNRPTVLGVLGLSGGVGASCLTAALAVRAARAGRQSLLVDGHPYGGGLDLLVGDDLGPGLGWPDLVGARGALDTRALWTRLPRLGSCAVLAWDRVPPPEDVPSGAAVWQALADQAELTLVDLPSMAAPWWQDWVGGCTDVLLVLGGGVGGVAAAMVGCDRLTAFVRSVRPVGAVVRTSGPAPLEAISRALAVPVVGTLPDDGGIERSLTRGAAVGTEAGPLADLADRLLTGLPPFVRGAA